MNSTSATDAELRTRIRQQEVVAELGQQALETDDIDQLMHDASVAVADTLNDEYCKVLELLPGGDEVLLRQGVGWRDGLVGSATVPTDLDSQAGYTLLTEEPIIVDDLETEERFSGPELLTSHDVVSGISVVIGSVDDPWGVLGTHTTERCEFTEHDANFVQSVANVLASAIERRERERDLRRQERRFEAIFEDPNILVGLLEPDGTVLDINGTAMEYVDADLDELTGEPFWETPWWGRSDGVRSDVREWVERAATGEYVDFEADLARPDGERYTLSGYFRPVTDADGEVVSIIVSDRDVTERKRQERALEESERRYRALAEYFPNGIVTLFDHDLEYTLAAGQGFADIPVEPAEVEGQGFEEVWDKETADALEPALEAALAGKERSVELEYAGREWVIHAVPLTDEHGDVFAGMTMAQDITERNERERELRDANAQLEAATEAAAVGTWEWHVQEDEMVMGPSFARKFGVDPDVAREGVSLDRFVEAIHEDDREHVDRKIDEALTSCGEYDAEYRVRNAEGELRWVVARGRVECDEDGVPVTFPGAITDITERKRAELELERNNEQLETLFDVLPVGVVVADGDGELIDANDTAREIWGGDVFDAGSVEEYEQFPIRWADSGELVEPEEMTLARVLRGEEVTDPAVVEIEAADGERRIVSTEGMPVRDESGEVVRGVVTLTDITDRRESQRALEESERRYRTLVENFPNGAVGLFDEDLRYTAVGGQLVDASGVTKEDRLGSRVSEIYPEELVEKVEPYFHAALDGETNSFEVEYHDRHLFAHTLPVRNGDDEVFAGMLVVQNVSERREVQRELRESEARFRMLAENLDEIVWMATADAEEFVYINPEFEEVWGLDREELYDDPLSFLDAVHPEDRERVQNGFAELPEEEFDDEFRIIRPDGEVRWVHARGDRVTDEDGEMVRVVGIGDDITERVERERELERALDLLEKTERIADVGGWEIDVETQDVFWTDHVFDLLEVTADEEPPLDEALDMYHEEDQPMVEDAVENALASGDPFDVEVRLRTDAGELRWLRLQGAPDTVDGDVVSLRGAAQDITERKQRERKLEELVDKLEESNERLEQFAYAASHDLQEPLRMVSSYLQLIERRYEGELDEDGREFLEFAVDGADRMREMIDGLLKYSRVDTRGDPFEPVELDDVLADVRENLQMKIEESDAEIEADPLPRVEGDEGQLRQVFQNLLSNAIEYSGDSPPRVHVTAERDGSRWTVSVIDEGIGIDPDDADRVFEVFQSLQPPDDHGGTGIGLALCERIVQRHGGRIWVESEPGEGATFSFTLPAASGTDGDRDE